MGVALKLPRIFSFADESEYKIPWKEGKGDRRISYIYAVGAVVVEGDQSLASLLDKLSDLREEAVHDPSIRHHEESARLESNGWHLTEDQISTSVPLWQFMGNSNDFKYHYRFFESLQKIDGTKLSRVYAVLHATIVRDLVRRYRFNPSIEFSFEEFTDLNSKFEQLVAFCAEPVEELEGRMPSAKVVHKGESDISAVADYMILGISRLIGQNEIECERSAGCEGHCRTSLFKRSGSTLGHLDSTNYHFRNFESIRGSISSLYRTRLHTGVLS